MFALDIDLNLLLGVCVVLGVLCLILLFVSARRKRDSLELQQDLNKNIEDFNRLLEKKEISREYWALVEGKIGVKELVFRDKIGRDRHDRRKRVVDQKNGQYAETQVTRLKQFQNKTSLVRCRLKTGRTHQIRVHLSHHGHPILGDPLYNPHSKSSRLMLHAFKLSFVHPLTLNKLSFTALSDTFERELNQNR